MVKFALSLSFTLVVAMIVTSIAAQEIIYLADCFEGGPGPDGMNYHYSEMLYYNEVSRSWNGELPSAVAQADGPTSRRPYAPAEWEKEAIKAVFPDGNAVTATVSSGTAVSKYRTFNCRKEVPSRQLYVMNAFKRCTSKYYYLFFSLCFSD
ncbi:hypothetical protein BC829DRAFT_422241 [Chytridium lagenaria]|nr:hypothetical protein BC829DRAFT_422241 [Chytridium lagenaria]